MGLDIILLVISLSFGLFASTVSGEYVVWQNDSISMTFGYGAKNVTYQGPVSNDTLYMSGYEMNFTATANGPIYKEIDADKGHFNLKFYVGTDSYGDLSGTTSRCIPLTATQLEVQEIVEDTVLSNIVGGVTYEYDMTDIMTTVKVQKFRHIQNTTDLVLTYLFTLDGDEVRTLTAYMRTAACDKPRTVGAWSDASKWSTGAVPGALDQVWLPEAAGVILLDSTSQVTIGGLVTNGGHIIGHHTVCPYGWNSNPTNNPSKKCYRVFETPRNFDDAEDYCRTSSGKGSMDAHLVQIADASELLVTQRLCRGQLGTVTTLSGCWIGLQDAAGQGKYSWIQPETVANNAFRDWRRYEWNNHTFSEGQSTNGELCVQIVPWQKDALIREQGSFNDVACKLEKPFVCQMFGTTRRASIVVQGPIHLSGGGIEGCSLEMWGETNIEEFYATDAASVVLNEPKWWLRNGTLYNYYNNETVYFNTTTNETTVTWNHDGNIFNITGYSWNETEAIHVENWQSNYTNTLTTLILEEGSSLTLNANVTSTNFTFVGETKDLGDANAKLGMQSYFTIAAGVVWTIPGINTDTLTADSYYWTNKTAPGVNGTLTWGGNATFLTYPDNSTWDYVDFPYDVTINSRATIMGKLDIGEGVRFNLNQGGSLSESHIILRGNNTFLNLGGGSQLSTYDAYELKVQHRGPVIGEYANDIAYEIAEPTTGAFNHTGVFRMILSGNDEDGNYQEEISQCIPYDASAQELANALARLEMVVQRGGITVRRYGNGEDKLFGYGYTHRIEMDAPPTSAFALGALDLNVHCYGIPNGCNCAETVVPLVDPTGQKMCHIKEGNSSRVNGDGCVTPPVIQMSRVSRLSYSKTEGKGSMVIIDGAHRLPPKSDVLISSAALGIGIVAADKIEWGGIAVDGVGTLIAAGTGWASWDAATVLFGPSWWDVRGYVTMLETAPPFDMIVGNFRLAGLGSILTACPHSNMTWQSGVWDGGTVGGRSRLNIQGDITASGTNKAVRYGMTVFIDAASTFRWSSGNISLANGAAIIVEGKFQMDTTDDTAYIGESHLLDSDDPDYLSMLKVEDEYQWHGYFGLELDPELRGGWYQNPLCGDQCTRENYMWVRESGVLSFAANSSTSINMPVNMLGTSQMVMGNSSYVELASGGICGNSVVVTINKGTTFSFTGGNMAMRATCVIKGEGELLIAGGAHDMSFSIDAHITISGGYMIWPLSRGVGSTITFNGGLLIEGDGTLEIQPYSTNIIVYGDVVFKDDCLLQFPMMGIAAQPSNSDRPDAPDETPRGTLTSVNDMRWEGGTLRGKADFIAQDTLIITGGTKKIRSLAKLVNNGTAEWDTGDIVMADNADFMNLGVVKMRGGAQFFDASDLYEGSVTPTESGGDIFAKQFHSYDIDSGKLSYLDYVALRTVYVSRAPVGWDVTDQDDTIQTPRNVI